MMMGSDSWGTSWPDCTVLSYRALNSTTVEVHVVVREGFFRRKREVVWQLESRPRGWFWAETGTVLVHAQAHVWAGLHNALGQ